MSTEPSQPLPPYANPKQYYLQPPQYQPQPPRKPVNDWVYALRAGIIILLLLGGGGGIFTALHNMYQAPPLSSSSANQQTANTSIPASAPGTVGTTQQSGYWTVTINSFTTSSGDSVFSPKSGNIYVIVNATVKNNDTAAHDVNPASLFALRDVQGIQYDITAYDNIHFLDGTVIAGQQLRGDIAYEVPNSMHQFTLQFQPSFDDTADIVQWNLSD